MELLGDNQNNGDYLFSLLVDEHRLVRKVLKHVPKSLLTEQQP